MSRLTAISSAGLITIPTGQFYFKASANAYYEELGMVEPCTVKPEFEDKDIFDSRSGTRVLARKDTTKTTVTIAATCKMLTSRVRALGWASNLTLENQSLSSANLLGITSVQVGGIYPLGKLNVTGVTVKDDAGSPVSYTLGVDYELDAESGAVRIIQKPGGATSNVNIVFGAPAILTAAARPRLGIGNAPDLQGAFWCRGTNTVGIRQSVKIPILRFRPSGEVGLSSEEYTQVEITGEAFADTTQAQGEELGTVQQLD